jgi:Protein of unknown function (DUF5672)
MAREAFENQPWECDFRTHPTSSPLVGVLVESRDHPALEYCLRNFSCMLPYASLAIMHSKENLQKIKKIIGNARNVRLIALPEPFDRDECMKLWTSPTFWGKFTWHTRVLIFNVDTGIKKNNILKFFKYQYIGAPWNHLPTGDPRVFQGNGGFSLRDPKLMYEICKRYPSPPEFRSMEDVWTMHVIVNHFPNTCLPTREECEAFSTEGNDVGGTFGFHDTSKYTPDTKNVYVVEDGPTRKLVHIFSAIVDERKNILPIIRLGIGPKGLRIPKEYDIEGEELVLMMARKDREPREFKIKRIKDDTLIIE